MHFRELDELGHLVELDELLHFVVVWGLLHLVELDELWHLVELVELGHLVELELKHLDEEVLDELGMQHNSAVEKEHELPELEDSHLFVELEQLLKLPVSSQGFTQEFEVGQVESFVQSFLAHPFNSNEESELVEMVLMEQLSEQES